MFKAHAVSIRPTSIRLASIAVAAAVVCVCIGVMIGRHGSDHSVGSFGYVAAAMMLIALFGLRSRETAPIIPDRIRQALDTLSEGLLILDERERIILANESFSQTVGRSQDALVGLRASDLPWLCSRASAKDDLPWGRAIRHGKPQLDQLMRYQLPSGSTRFFSINASPISSGETEGRGALATFRDVTEGEEHRAELERMLAMLRNSRDEISSKNRELEILAKQDSLTGCLNRRALFAMLEDVWMQTANEQASLCCLMIDADHFKQVNDQHGHHAGDAALRAVANAITASCDESSLVCRYGGEEFCVVLRQCSLQDGARQAESIRAAIENLTFEPAVRLTVSIGVSSLEFGATDPQQLINQADKCLYVAKGQGRNQVVKFDSSIETISIEPEAIEGARELGVDDATTLPFQAVTALVSALAYRDSETAEHSRRVADLCVRTASGILDQRNTYILEIAALLHDIGKIGVPDEVLLKPGELTPQEWKLMERHDRIGVEIVAGTFNHSELNEIIRSHQAHYSGRESEQHLPQGNAIPLAARLLNIVDSYDSMVSDHVYRDGCSHDKAIAELKRCAGTQFDPVLVEHFAATVNERRDEENEDESIPKQTAMQIGLQIERLADALEARDVDGLQTLASRLGAMARHHRIESIATAADKIEAAAAEENMQWINLLRDSQQLLNLCRVTQNSFLTETESHPSEP